MPTKPGYKQTEIEQIPKEWKVVTFDDYVELRHGYQFRKYDFVENNGIPILKIEQISKDGWINLSNCGFIDKFREEEFQNDIIRNGDILMALTGATLGKIAKVTGINRTVLQNYRVGNFFPKDLEKLSKGYFYHVLGSKHFMDQIFRKVHVAAQPNIGKSDFLNTQFFLPPIFEQNRIDKVEIRKQ